LAEQFVTRGVTERIVHGLEAIEVHIQDRKRFVTAPCCGKRLAKPLEESRAVGQSGERIGTRKQRDLFLGLLSLSNVDDDALDFEQPSIFITSKRIAGLNPTRRAEARSQTKLDRVRTAPCSNMCAIAASTAERSRGSTRACR
jgi:hypothetical protein